MQNPAVGQRYRAAFRDAVPVADTTFQGGSFLQPLAIGEKSAGFLMEGGGVEHQFSACFFALAFTFWLYSSASLSCSFAKSKFHWILRSSSAFASASCFSRADSTAFRTRIPTKRQPPTVKIVRAASIAKTCFRKLFTANHPSVVTKRTFASDRL